jgi:hypothetical protein
MEVGRREAFWRAVASERDTALGSGLVDRMVSRDPKAPSPLRSELRFDAAGRSAGAFSVQYSTNLSDWSLLGPATPRYLFTDTNAPAQPQRFYRQRWP